MNAALWRFKVFVRRVRYSVQIFFKVPFVYRNWVFFLLSRFRGGTGILELRNGLRIKFRTQSSDRATASELFLLGGYKEDPEYLVGPRDVVVDIGANIGSFSLDAALRCPEGRVISVEPLQSNFDLLQENLRLNHLTNVRARRLALDATDGERTLHFGGDCPSFHWNHETGCQETVPTRSLASFLREEQLGRIDLMKIDCEGAEFDMLLPAGGPELGQIRRIIIEYHDLSPEKNHRVLRAHLERHGFEVKTTEGGWNGSLRAIRR